jgi:hypothetical protein
MDGCVWGWQAGGCKQSREKVVRLALRGGVGAVRRCVALGALGALGARRWWRRLARARGRGGRATGAAAAGGGRGCGRPHLVADLDVCQHAEAEGRHGGGRSCCFSKGCCGAGDGGSGRAVGARARARRAAGAHGGVASRAGGERGGGARVVRREWRG